MRWYSAAVWFLLLRLCVSFRSLPNLGARRFGFVPTTSFMNSMGSMDQSARAGSPSRYDECKVLISGVVGTPPKEIYLKNGHYVLNFALAVVGHFKAVHQQEYHKPTETMWISVEMWDDLAKGNYADIRKGHVVRGVGYLVLNKWIDKLNGEEKKMYKVRVTKLLSSEEFNSVNMLLEDTVGTGRSGTGVHVDDSDSAFASEQPALPDQTRASEDRRRDASYVYSSQPTHKAVPPRPGMYPAPPASTALQGPARAVPVSASSRAIAAPPSRAGAEVWDLLDNAKEGEYLPWWE